MLNTAVDFRSINVSVGGDTLRPIYPIKKSLMATAILILFTFGAFAISLAYEPAAERSVFSTLSPDHGSGGSSLGADTSGQRFALICLSGDVSRSAQPNFQTYRFNYVRVVDPLKLFFFLENHVPKVSLQILQSVLLI